MALIDGNNINGISFKLILKTTNAPNFDGKNLRETREIFNKYSY